MTGRVAVYAPTDGFGGVEQVARKAYEALLGSAEGARLHLGPRRIVASRRPPAAWMSLTWKTHALVTASHPRLSGPSLLWLHGAELTRDSSRTHGLLRERALRTSDVLLAVSPLAEGLLPREHRHRVQLVGPPIASAPTREPLRSRRHGRDVLRLLSVGRAVPRKGHDTAVAVAAALAVDRRVRLDVVGPGPDLPRLRALAAASERSGLKVVVHGAVPAARRDQLYATSDAMLFLPRHEEGEFEGLGLVVLEAAAFGCPAVVLDCGGSRFGIAQGESGLLLAASEPVEALVEAVLALVASPDPKDAARRFAQCFALPAWQARVRALSEGARPDWQWPTHS